MEEQQKTAQRPLTVNLQYTKDLSFENPHAPVIYAEMKGKNPALNVGVNVSVSTLSDQSYEIVVTYEAKGVIDENKTCFMLELKHAGVVTLAEGLDDQIKELLLFVEGPRFLFPEARNSLSLLTGNAGFPPLTLHPVDFHQLYLKRKQQNAVAAARENLSNDGDGGDLVDRT